MTALPLNCTVLNRAPGHRAPGTGTGHRQQAPTPTGHRPRSVPDYPTDAPNSSPSP